MKTSKKILAVVLSVMLLISVMPFAAFAADVDSYQSLVDEVAAFNAGDADVTITLTADVELQGTITIDTANGKTLTINGGKNITLASGVGSAFYVKQGSLNLGKNTITGAPSNYKLIYLTGSTNPQDANYSNVTIAGATINCTNGYAVMISANGNAAYGANITTKSGTVYGYYGALYVNGSVKANAGNNIANVKVSGGTLKSTEDEGTAIYGAGYANYTITSGTLTAASAAYFKAGNVTISGGTFNGTGADKAYEPSGNGYEPTGEAVVLESNSGYAPVTSVSITGGTFNSANADPIGTYANNTSVTAPDNFISGGTFKSAGAPADVSEYYTPETAAAVESGEKVVNSAGKVVDISTIGATIKKSGVTTYYATLYDAIYAAEAGDTIVMQKDLSVSNVFSKWTFADGVTVDLNGYTLKTTVRTKTAFSVMGGSVEMKNGTIDGDVAVFNDATFTAGNKLVINGYNYAISGNHNTSVGATINVKKGATVTTASDVCPAIYFPMDGNLNISGGTISGPSAVYIRTGNLNITGGELIATGAANDQSTVANGAVATGDAVVIQAYSSAYGAAPVVSITGGKFTSENNKAVATYEKDNADTAPEAFISGGTFSDDPADTYIAEGLDGMKTTTGFIIVPEETAEDTVCYKNGVAYTDLATAMNAARSGDTVVLVKDTTLTKAIAGNFTYLSATVTLDLNGHNVDASQVSTAYAISLRYSNNINIISETPAEISLGAKQIDITTILASGGITVGENVTISATTGCPIVAKASKGIIVIDGTIKSEGSFGITQNGTQANSELKVVVGETGVVKGGTNAAGIYGAGYATWEINGKVEGGNGVYIKSGELSFGENAEIKGTANEAEYQYNGNGINPTGAALVVDNCSYPGGVPQVTIENGTFISEKSEPVQSFAYGENEPVEKFISGGSFSDILPADLVAEGFVPVTEPNEQGKYTVAVVQYGTIEQMTGATITGNGTSHEKISIENTTMRYAEPDYSVGRYYAGYYLSGVKFVAPEGTVISENARYTNGSIDSETGQLKVKNLYTAKDGANYMYSWPHVTEESLKEAIAAGVNKTWTYTFDWDGDGYFEQEAIIEIVCDTVTLVKDGEQVYPVVANNGSSLTLTDGVKFNAYIDADAYGVDANEAVVKVTYNHNADVSQTKAFSTDTIALTDATKYVKAGDPYDGTYKFAFAVAPAQYAEDITIALYADADAETPLFTTTTNVKSMCEKVIALAETESTYAAYANLCKALADYCQAAQVFFNYDAPATPAYYNEAVTTLAAADMEVPTAFVGIEGAGFSFTIVSALEVNVFYNGDLEIQNVSIDSTKGADTVNAETTTKGGRNCINITGIASGNLDNVITVNTSAGVVELSATNIAKAIAGSTNTNYANLARALYLYSVQASAFFGA